MVREPSRKRYWNSREEFVDEAEESCSINEYLESAKDQDLSLFF